MVKRPSPFSRPLGRGEDLSEAARAKALDLQVTLWPSFPHFNRFANDSRLSGIRLNSAMISNPELEEELAKLAEVGETVPLWFDVKGRQLRVTEVFENDKYLDLRLNHPIQVDTPTVVLFKAGCDHAVLERVEEDGHRLIFRGGPSYNVIPGESLHIRDPSLRVGGQQFVQAELDKIARVREAGFSNYFLSYVESKRDVDEFLELIGPDAQVRLKIESQKGLDYVANEFMKDERLTLVAARGDMYVELLRPHEILAALKLIIEKDPLASCGSRILLSVVGEPIPSCADFCELAWLYDIGYRDMMLCDELCLKGDLLGTAVNAFDAFRGSYATP